MSRLSLWTTLCLSPGKWPSGLQMEGGMEGPPLKAASQGTGPLGPQETEGKSHPVTLLPLCPQGYVLPPGHLAT